MKKILIIDDEKEFCSFIKNNLERQAGYEVIVASDGKAGLAAAHKHKPDLILLDIVMPEMSGMEVLKKLKDDQGTIGIPVIMLTAKTDEALKMQAAYSFGEDYVTKPIDVEILRSKIEAILTRRGVK